MLEFSFGMLRCRNEGLVVGLRIRASTRAWVCRWVDTREPICGRWDGRESHWEVVSSSFCDEGERGAEVRREERSSISSRSSVGSVADVFVGGLDLEVVVGVVERSRLLSAVRIRWDFAARIRALLRACWLSERCGRRRRVVVLLSPYRALVAQGAASLSHLHLGCYLLESHEERQIWDCFAARNLQLVEASWLWC
jgi:hypothetical protein